MLIGHCVMEDTRKEWSSRLTTYAVSVDPLTNRRLLSTFFCQCPSQAGFPARGSRDFSV